jgi:transcriptional regulator with XRE-family HTH domain
MPRKNPLPDEEIEIGRRVRMIRERRQMSRSSFAQEMAVDGSIIANIEHGRAPLRFELAMRICARWSVNPRWLATGALPVVFQIHFGGYDSRIAPRTLFSSAYEQHLRKGVEKALVAIAKRDGCRIEELQGDILPPIEPGHPEMIAARERMLMQWAINALNAMPPALHERFTGHISAAAESFIQENRKAIVAYRKKQGLPPVD